MFWIIACIITKHKKAHCLNGLQQKVCKSSNNTVQGIYTTQPINAQAVFTVGVKVTISSIFILLISAGLQQGLVHCGTNYEAGLSRWNIAQSIDTQQSTFTCQFWYIWS